MSNATNTSTPRFFSAAATVTAMDIGPRLSARAKVEVVAVLLDARLDIPHIVTRSNARVVKSLVAKGLATTETDPGVYTTVRLTEAGKAIAAMYRDAVCSGEIAAY
jgi:hypothetical protein